MKQFCRSERQERCFTSICLNAIKWSVHGVVFAQSLKIAFLFSVKRKSTYHFKTNAWEEKDSRVWKPYLWVHAADFMCPAWRQYCVIHRRHYMGNRSQWSVKGPFIPLQRRHVKYLTLWGLKGHVNIAAKRLSLEFPLTSGHFSRNM